MGFAIFRGVSYPGYGRILVLTFAVLTQVFPSALRALQETSQGQFQTQDNSGEPEAYVHGAIRQTEPSGEMRSLVVTVGSVQGFAHEKRCAGELCDGFVVSAHDDSISYVLICASHYYGENDSDKQYNESSRAKNCRAVRPERWAAKTDDRDFLFYSGPNVLFAEYEVSSEGKR